MITVSKTFFVRLIHFPYFKIGYYISAAVCSVQRGVSAMQSSSNELWETGLFVLSIHPSHIHSLHYIPFILFNLFIYSWSLFKLCFVWKDFGSNFDLWIMKSSSLWLKKIPITGIIFALLYLSLSFALHLFNPLKLYNSSFKDSGWVHGSRRINTTATTPTYFLCTRPERRERDVV